ncbi:MAG: Mu-like prophage major head subunit gpT family protein [Firmicutes bacterium]|nr:Mu-like prophage major head subunit gpT family protein [Bacillota bacterium]
MIINQTNLQAVYRGFRVLFLEALAATQPKWPQIATLIPSSTSQEEYRWLGRLPRMREWVGERVVQNLSNAGFTIKNRDWEATIEVDRNDIEDDTLGLYSSLIQAMGQAAATHPDELVFGLLAAGFTNPCYDGQYFFDTDHKDGDGPVQSNRGDKVLTAQSYADARAQMMSLLDERGNPMQIMPDLLIVPPQLEKAGLEILQADRLANGATNIYRNSAQLLVSPYLASSPTAWYLVDTSKPIKPLIFQRRRDPQFVAKDRPDDDTVFMRKKFIYGTDSRDNAGYGLWQLAFGSTGTVA